MLHRIMKWFRDYPLSVPVVIGICLAVWPWVYAASVLIVRRAMINGPRSGLLATTFRIHDFWINQPLFFQGARYCLALGVYLVIGSALWAEMRAPFFSRRRSEGDRKTDGPL